MLFIKLSDPEFHKSIPKNKKGVYKISCLDREGKPTPVNRLLGQDEEGVLYIGCSPRRTLHERLADLIKALSPNYKSVPHIIGKKYYRENFQRLREILPFDSLAIQFELSEKPKELEDKLIDEYRGKFGEEPPFNSY